MLTKNDIAKIIEENTEQIKKYGVKSIGIFGSFVKFAHNRKSDVDILVGFYEGQKTFDNYVELKFFLEKLFHRKVDLVIKKTLKPRIKQNILEEATYAKL